MATTNFRIPDIIDVEASGFGADSYPIEVGVVLGSGKRFSSIIKPAEGWTHWDISAESIHGISRLTLESEGRSVATVAIELNALLAGKTVFSDGWVVDKPWLINLFDQAGVEMEFTVSALESILHEKQIQCWDQIKEKLLNQQKIIRHRASNDAWLIQRTFLLSRQQMNMPAAYLGKTG